MTASNAGCSTLVEAWMKPVEGADLPSGQTVGDWIVFGDMQTGKLDTANDRIVNGYATIAKCEARDREAVREGSKGWLSRLFS